jgi:hypothetical protein
LVQDDSLSAPSIIAQPSPPWAAEVVTRKRSVRKPVPLQLALHGMASSHEPIQLTGQGVVDVQAVVFLMV